MVDITIFFLILHGIGIAIFLFLKPKLATFIMIIFCVFTLDYFSRWFGFSRYFARVPFLLAILLSLRLGLDFLSHRIVITNNMKIIKIMLRFSIFLFFTAIISTLYNNESIILGLYELRYYLLLMVLCLGIYFYRPLPANEKVFMKLMIILGLIQIPFTIVQHFLVMSTGISSLPSALDRSSGTFAGYPMLVFFQCVAIGITMAYQLRKRRSILKINNYLLIAILTIPLILSYSRSAMGFVALTLVIVFLRHLCIQKSFSYLLQNIFPMTLLIIVVLLSFYQFFWKQHSMENQLNPNYIIEYFFREPQTITYMYYEQSGGDIMGRARALIDSIKLISRSSGKFLLGLGSGSTSEASIFKTEGSHFYRYGPLAGIGGTQVSKIIAELGFIGLMIFIILFILLSKQIKKKSIYENGHLIMDIYMVIIINILMHSFYSRIFQSTATLFVLAYFMALSQITLSDDS